MNKKQVRHIKLWIYLALIIFILLGLFTFCTFILTMFLYRQGIIKPNGNHIPPNLLSTLLVSIFLGTAITLLIGKIIIKPIINLNIGLTKIANGDFTIKLKEDSKIIEIKEMNENFNKMTKELSHIETLRSDFVSNISHEFKTPLTAIQGYATILQNQSLDKKKQEECIDKIILCTRRLSNLTGNILLLTKLENQEIILDKKTFSLDEQIRTTILALENEWTEKQIDFDLSLPTIYINSNEELLYQVWFNLINNAIKFSSINSQIKIELKDYQNKLVVIIQDFGCGINEDSLNHIFDKFYQADNSKNQNGNGIGLALVYKIISLCNGEINVHSKLDEGTKFSITFKK